MCVCGRDLAWPEPEPEPGPEPGQEHGVGSQTRRAVAVDQGPSTSGAASCDTVRRLLSLFRGGGVVFQNLLQDVVDAHGSSAR